jgi:hypothetical protein
MDVKAISAFNWKTILYVLACVAMVIIIIAMQLLARAPMLLDANPPRDGERRMDGF